MRLNSISAKNYRTLQNATIDFPSNYCTLSGPNNAGKSSYIRIIECLFEPNKNRPWPGIQQFSYDDDLTQWIKTKPPISISYVIGLTRSDDPALITFIETFNKKTLDGNKFDLRIDITIDREGKSTETATISGEELTSTAVKELLGKLKQSNSIFFHNSALDNSDIYYRAGKFTAMFDLLLNAEEFKVLSEAEAAVQKKVKKLAKGRREELINLLGKLNDKYEVEFSTLDSSFGRRMPFSINLSDKNVEVPLSEWGSGTQNRTKILMSILQARRAKLNDSDQDRITPIVIIEEPESFLHPSAQAEFGRLLRDLSDELEIQIIASTHSAYMLNQANPASNILLQRKERFKKLHETVIAPVTDANWMAPFAQQLGIMPPEFEAWRPIFGVKRNNVLLVEGEIDKEYIEHLRKKHKKAFSIPESVEVIAYNGKDALRNTAMLKFVLRSVERAFLTFDLDAAKDVERSLLALDLKSGIDFTAVGLNKAGRDNIEGLLPDRILNSVNGRSPDLIAELTSSSRNDAKRKLKKLYLDAFKNDATCTDDELQHFTKLGKLITKKFL